MEVLLEMGRRTQKLLAKTREIEDGYVNGIDFERIYAKELERFREIVGDSVDFMTNRKKQRQAFQATSAFTYMMLLDKAIECGERGDRKGFMQAMMLLHDMFGEKTLKMEVGVDGESIVELLRAAKNEELRQLSEEIKGYGEKVVNEEPI